MLKALGKLYYDSNEFSKAAELFELGRKTDPYDREWLMELGRLRREVTAVEPIGEPRKSLLHELAQREVCGFAECPARARTAQGGVPQTSAPFT